MAKYVNYKKRSVQLPKGCKNLSDVLDKTAHSQQNRPSLREIIQNSEETIQNSKCDFCGTPAVSGSMSYGIAGCFEDESNFSCKQCDQDLHEFYSRPENALPEDVNFDDDAAANALHRLLKDIKTRQDEFMRRKVSERKR